jgi:energy-converting hydrogenase Eha subunit C
MDKVLRGWIVVVLLFGIFMSIHAWRLLEEDSIHAVVAYQAMGVAMIAIGSSLISTIMIYLFEENRKLNAQNVCSNG